MVPVVPQSVNRLIQDPKGQSSTYPFPQNLAGILTKTQRRTLMDWMLKNYIWGQVMERRPFEATWDKLLYMCRAAWKYSDADIDEGTRLERVQQGKMLDAYGDPLIDGSSNEAALCDRIKISDTVVFDAIDRLTNLNHFIAFKETLPVRYELPEDVIRPYENDVYSPSSGITKSANAWLKFNSENQGVFRSHWITSRHHYTYGVSFVSSEFNQKIGPMMRRQPDKTFKQTMELLDIGITFDPISIRKLWLNWRLPAWKMHYQPCPFHFEEVPRFAIVANEYDSETNPMGYSNTQSILESKGDWLFAGNETESMQKAFQSAYPDAKINFQQILDPQYSVELLWNFYPMIPIMIVPVDPNVEQDTHEPKQVEMFLDKMPDPKDPSGQKMVGIKPRRFIMSSFGGNLVSGMQEIIRLQENFYPYDWLPIYGSAHMPSLDDGAYSPAIGTVLEGHYTQICKALLQFLENKEWNNDPPVEIQQNSPAITYKGINKKGARIPVFGINDIRRRESFDGTQTTVQFLQFVREQAQTSAKSTDAVLGKALGSRTSASEAQNVFQTAMSGITTDVNLFNHDIMGGYANRVWAYTGLWVDPDVLQLVTGTYGFVIKPEHMAIRFGLKWDVGSQFMESITRQQHYQYLLQSCVPGDPDLQRANIYKNLMIEWRMKDVDTLVNDQGRAQQIQLATEQAVRAYYGEMVMVDPDQDHALAIKVLKSFLMDRNSYWNTNPTTVVNGQILVQLMQVHQYWLQLQMMQQNLMMQQQALMGAGGDQLLQPLQNPNESPQASPGKMATSPGQSRQKSGR